MITCKKASKRCLSQVEWMLEEVDEIDSLERYRKLLDTKKPADPHFKLQDFREVLQWKVPQAYKSEYTQLGRCAFKVCDIARLASKPVAIVARIVAKTISVWGSPAA